MQPWPRFERVEAARWHRTAGRNRRLATDAGLYIASNAMSIAARVARNALIV